MAQSSSVRIGWMVINDIDWRLVFLPQEYRF